MSLTTRKGVKKFGRRSFLLGTTGLFAAAGTFWYCGRRILAKTVPPRFDSSDDTGHLSDQGMRTILALVEVLIPQRHGKNTEDMIAMINEATIGTKGVLSQYQSAAELLDRLTLKTDYPSFDAAPVSLREKIVDRLLWKYDSGGVSSIRRGIAKLTKRAERLFQSRGEQRFRELVVRDLLIRFYASPIAWKIAGYSTFPGRPADPRAYTKPMKLEDCC